MEILSQLGGLVLGSVPTIIFFLILILAYSVLVRRPLAKTLAERRSRTSGAVEQARGAIAAAEAETAVYEDKLRAARTEILAARDRRLKQWQSERDATIASARSEAQAKVQAARQDIEASASAARLQIEDATGSLSDQILQAVLPGGSNLSEARQ